MLTDFQSNNQYIQTLQGVAKEKTPAPGLGYVSCYPLILCQFSSTFLEAHLNFVFYRFYQASKWVLMVMMSMIPFVCCHY